MRFLTFYFAVFFLFSFHTKAQKVVGSTFPDMEAETIEDQTITLPAHTQGRVALVGLAYSKKSEDDLATWMSPVFNTFIQQKISGGGLFADFAHDIDVYFVPMFTGVKAAAKGTAKRKAAKNIDERLLPYILFYKGSLKPYKEALDFERKDVPYFFLIDQAGKIVYATSGAYSDQKMEDIESAIDNL